MVVVHDRYAPSGRFRPLALLAWLVVFSPFVFLAGYLMAVALWSGVFVVGVVPLAAGAVAAAAPAAAVRLGKCRNRWVGGAAGAVAGLTAFLAYYQFDLAGTVGWDHVHRADLLPEYVEFRLRTDRVVRVRGGNNPPAAGVVRPDGPIPAGGWARFGLNALAATLLPAAAGAGLAGRPFAESRGRWLHGHTLHLSPADARAVADAVRAGDADRLAVGVEPGRPKVMADTGALTAYYLPYDPLTPVFVYLQIQPGAITGGRPVAPLKYDRLSDAEAAALADRLPFPGLKVGRPEDAATAVGRPTARAAGSAVEDLPADEAGTAMSGSAVAVGFVRTLSPLLAGLAAAVAGGVAAFLTFDEFGRAGAAAVGAFGLVALGVGLALTVQWEAGLGNRYLAGRVAAAVRRRAEPVVDPDDPAAVYVQVIPRANWGRVMVENASDSGLLKLDPARRLILFEGDRQRWRVPAAAVTGLAVEEFCVGPPDPAERNVFPVLVLAADVGGERWEVPLNRPHLAFTRPTAAGRRAAIAELEADLRAFVGLGG
jgi:hypothetical protein